VAIEDHVHEGDAAQKNTAVLRYTRVLSQHTAHYEIQYKYNEKRVSEHYETTLHLLYSVYIYIYRFSKVYAEFPLFAELLFHPAFPFTLRSFLESTMATARPPSTST
jgi:hypothetical protein